MLPWQVAVKKKSPKLVLKQWKCFLLVLHFSFSSPIITLLYAKCNFLFLFDVGVKYEQNRTKTEFVIDSVHLSSHINCDEASERSGTEMIDRCLNIKRSSLCSVWFRWIISVFLNLNQKDLTLWTDTLSPQEGDLSFITIQVTSYKPVNRLTCSERSIHRPERENRA